MSGPVLPDLGFTVAITGHRQLAPERAGPLEVSIAAILADVAAALEQARMASPLDAQRALRLRLVSGMAEGADQIAMRAAKATAPWRAEAILPFGRAAFLQTFRDPAAGAQALDDLLDAETPVLELADWAWHGHADDDRTHEYWRARRYVTLGQMLVRQADLVIALWRGTPPEGRGGTAEVVAEARRAGVPILWLHPETGDLRSFVADPESPHQFPIGQPLEASLPGGGAAIRMAVSNVLPGADRARAAAIRTFLEAERRPLWRKADGSEITGSNAWPYAMMMWALLADRALYKWPFVRARRVPDAAGRQRRWRFCVLEIPFWWTTKLGGAPQAGAPDLRPAIAGATAADAPLAPFMRHADAVASRLGHHYRSGYIAIFLLAALAVVLAGGWLVWHDGKPGFVALELGAIGLAVYLWARMAPRGLMRIRGHNTHQRWLDARLVSESLRSVRLLSWIGFAGRRPAEAAAPPDGGHETPRPVWTPWLVNAIAACPPMPQGAFTPARIGLVARALGHVIEDQRQYHHGNGARLEKLHERLDMVGLGGVLLGVVVSLLFLLMWLVAGHPWMAGDCTPEAVQAVLQRPLNSPGLAGAMHAWAARCESDGDREWLHHWGYAAAFFGSIGPAFAAAMASIRYHGDYERFAKRSEETAAVLARLKMRADDLVRRAGSGEAARQAPAPPLFEDLLELTLDTQDILDKDLLDWRFAYAARPMPLP
ncbi:MAG TPA: hypothetical protein VFF98_02975 [Novosphingobium sp.]|nr:hypothetical protein [Novosphingobium sp.]